MRLTSFMFFVLLSAAGQVLGATKLELLEAIQKKIKDPAEALRSEGNLAILGNSSLDQANIVLLPEIHDDPASLMVQLLLLARERNRGGNFLVLDESLAPLKQSSWELFSEKTMEILAALDTRKAGIAYSPKNFELNLKNIMQEFRRVPGQMTYLPDNGIWSFSSFAPNATLFYGWDTANRAQTLSTRNVQMVNSLKAALKKSDRIFVMLGARHVPDLEYSSSQHLLCKNKRFKKMEDYFSAVNKKFGPKPELTQGIGATLPIYEFLKDKRYAVAFSNKLYGELYRVVKNLFADPSKGDCFYIF